ncbi:hypothetical protein L0F63_000348 [Massospora cicadina]|nr:hypothetical protein L0F63_000348 [Massospora cicadina]
MQSLNYHLAHPTPTNVHAITKFFVFDSCTNLLDINYHHPTHGLPCLHQAAVLGNEELVLQLLLLEVNVFSHNKCGLAPIDQLTPSSVVVVDPNRLPRLKGQLKSGPITLVAIRSDTVNVCYGSINLAHAKLCINASDPQKFEVTGKDQTKFHLQAAMLDESKRWIVAITQTKQYLQRYQASPEMPAAVGATMNSPWVLPTVKNACSCTNSVDSLELLLSQEGLVMASTLSLHNLIFRSCFSIS